MPNAGGLEIYGVWKKPALLVLGFSHGRMVLTVKLRRESWAQSTLATDQAIQSGCSTVSANMDNLM